MVCEGNGRKKISKATSIPENDKKLLHWLLVGERNEVRWTASRFIEGVDENCPACGEVQTVKPRTTGKIVLGLNTFWSTARKRAYPIGGLLSGELMRSQFVKCLNVRTGL